MNTAIILGAVIFTAVLIWLVVRTKDSDRYPNGSKQ